MWLVFSSLTGRLAQAHLCSVVLQDRLPSLALVWQDGWLILVFSSYIFEGWITLHLLMFRSFIRRVAYTGLYLVVL